MSLGHRLFALLQEGKYFAATRQGVAYDYWPELPEARREQYERAAETLIQEAQSLRRFDSDAVTLPPPATDNSERR